MAYPSDYMFHSGPQFGEMDASRRYSYLNEVYGESGQSDIARQYYADIAMRSVDWQHDEDWYQAHQSRQAQYLEMRKLGINPLTAARSVAGIQDAGSPAAGAYPSGTGADSRTQSLVDAFGTGLNALSGSIDAATNMRVGDANAANLHADTANKVAQNPWIAPQAKANIATQEAQAAESNANVGVLNARQDQIIGEIAKTDADRRMVEAQLDRFDEVTDAQITNWQNQSRLYFEQANTEQSEQKQIDANIELTNAKTQETRANTAFINQETQQLKTYNEFSSELGIPWNADVEKAITYYEQKGDYKAMQRFVDGVFDAAAARGSGTYGAEAAVAYDKQYNINNANNYNGDAKNPFEGVSRLSNRAYNSFHNVSPHVNPLYRRYNVR